MTTDEQINDAIQADIESKLQDEEIDASSDVFYYEDEVTVEGITVDYEAKVTVVTENDRSEMDYFDGTGYSGGWHITSAKAEVEITIKREVTLKLDV